MIIRNKKLYLILLFLLMGSKG